ncbi:hypothetical protein ACFWP2_09980 [Kitasatospora sp. NPDC058444]|uniref:hypothetical protein n=1 Tax=Kitasatospora sp. NPDC058444 TaxID=3346504 RepID=UPI003665AF8D
MPSRILTALVAVLTRQKTRRITDWADPVVRAVGLRLAGPAGIKRCGTDLLRTGSVFGSEYQYSGHAPLLGVGQRLDRGFLTALRLCQSSGRVAASGLQAPAAVAKEDSSPMAGHTLGGLRLTPRILRRAHAVDQVAGKGITGRLLWLVREAHGYLRHEETAAAVRAEVRGALTATGARMVIAHSLGSVVFYDMLNRGEVPPGRDRGPGVTTFVTCGSPLSWLCIRRGVHTPGAPLSVPAGVHWTNLHSPNDVMNKGAGLSHLAVGITDVVAHNGGVAKAHDVHRYLAKEAIVERIAMARTL